MRISSNGRAISHTCEEIDHGSHPTIQIDQVGVLTETVRTMNVSQLLVKCLEQEGVDYIFGIPGEENLLLLDALIDSPIRFIPVRHEQGVRKSVV